MADITPVVNTEAEKHEHYWLQDALCTPTLAGHATVLFRCRGCALIAYGHTVPSEIQRPR